MQVWAGVGPVLVQLWQQRAQSRCRRGRGEPSPVADAGRVGPVAVPISAVMWRGFRCVAALCRCRQQPATIGRAAQGVDLPNPNKRRKAVDITTGVSCVARCTLFAAASCVLHARCALTGGRKGTLRYSQGALHCALRSCGPRLDVLVVLSR